MDISPAHAAARLAALRLAAITASHVLLDAGAGNITIEVYPAPRPAPGDAPGVVLLAAVACTAAAALDTDNLRITLPAGIEGLIVAAGDAAWARIKGRDGAWWADASVSDTAGDGEIKLDAITCAPGAWVRLLSAQFQS